jgi:putative NADH-flavin reductase
MQVTVLGASGKVGRLVVAEALGRGHQVTAVVHRHNPFWNMPGVRVITGDVHDAAIVTASLQGSQAVLSALGSWNSASKDIVTAGISHTIPAMHRLGISRIITLTGEGADAPGDRRPLSRRLTHAAARLVAGKILRDGETQIALLAASQLDWTVLRSPIMTNGHDRLYRLSLRPAPPWQTIPRRAVAKAMLDQLDGPGYLGAAPFIYRQ